METQPNLTCGELYRQALDKWTGMDPECVRLFAVGFVMGQAEKVFLGAAPGAMFRPSEQYREHIERCASYAMLHYDLNISLVGEEVWILRPAFLPDLKQVRRTPKDTPAYHALRAYLCGIPVDHVDPEYHLRPGHGQPCDT